VVWPERRKHVTYVTRVQQSVGDCQFEIRVAAISHDKTAAKKIFKMNSKLQLLVEGQTEKPSPV
jgi:hypothetical protein